jgi:hypothetical protein
MYRPPRDVFGTTVRFVCGAIFGAIIGFRLVVATYDPIVFVGSIVGCAVLVGAIAAWFGDRFWDALGKFRWWPWG